MVDTNLWSKLMFLLNTKPRNAKNLPKLATAHTARDASSSMALRTNLVSKSHQQFRQHSLRKTRVRLSTWQLCSRLPLIPKTKRLKEKILLHLM